MEHYLYIGAFSIIAAVIYSFAALDFPRKSNRKQTSSRRLWLLSASVTMGIGIWGMAIFLNSHDTSLRNLSVITPAIVSVASLFICLLFMRGKWSDEQLKLKSALLKESKQQNHSLIELNPDGVYIINKDRTLTVVNRSLEDLTGYTSEELLGRPYTFLIAHADPPRLESLFQRTLGGEPLQGETQIMKKDGSVFDAEVTNIPYYVDNEIRGIVGTMKDLTVVRRVEQKIRESEKLAVVGELAAGVAHEIRNPLTTLKGFTQTMLNTSSSPEMRTYLTIMLEEIESINVITNEFMVLAKPHMTITTSVDVVPLIMQVIKLLNTRANLSNVILNSEFLIESGMILGEENQIKKMLVNLIKNAIESMPDGGNVTLTATAGEQGNMLLYIKDEGVGMSASELQQIGHPFYTTKENGIGLGLVVSKKIIENHQGNLRFKSTRGEGTIAEISLPGLEETIKADDTPLIS